MTRDDLRRFAPPAALLLAVTVTLLLVRAAIGEGEPAGPRAALTPPVTRTVEVPRVAPRAARTRAAADRQFHEIRAGDTLGSVADRYDTTLEAVLGLNPGVDPTGLQVGQRIRVK